jgi:hypothetical protein
MSAAALPCPQIDCEDQADDRVLGERTGVPGIPIALDLVPDAADHILADTFGE